MIRFKSQKRWTILCCFKQTLSPEKDPLDTQNAVLTGIPISFGKKNQKKIEQCCLFSETNNKFPQIFPLDTQNSVLKSFSHFYGKEVENFGSKSGTDEKIFFTEKLICGNINCSFEICREPFNKSPKTFRPKSQNDKHMCGYFRKKNSRKEIFCLRRIHF